MPANEIIVAQWRIGWTGQKIVTAEGKDVPNLMQLPGMTLTVQKKINTLVYLSWLRFLMEIFASFLI